MKPVLRIFGIGTIFFGSAIAWLILGGVTSQRTHTQRAKLGGAVNDLWGSPQRQAAPELAFDWHTTHENVRSEVDELTKRARVVREQVVDTHTKAVSPASTRVDVALRLDQRLKGLLWYSLYDVGFEGAWSYVHAEPVAGTLRVAFRFPDASGVYDGFHFLVDGRELGDALRPVDGKVEAALAVAPGQEVSLRIGYKSRGLDAWTYLPAQGVASLAAFDLNMTTDFDRIDFPPTSMSPSTKTKLDRGWRLGWRFDRVVTGHDLGMTMPAELQPGELAASLAYSAPISLFFYFLVVFVLTTLARIEVHPINYLFLAGAFFSFHLLFAYGVDHLTVVPAFALSSAVSVALAVSYLRLVVGPRFAFVEAGLAQVVYLVGFSLAHFWEGFTGLTVTVLSIVTLFLLMQLTGRLSWATVLSGGTVERARAQA